MDAMCSKARLTYNDTKSHVLDEHSRFSFTDNASGEADSISITLNNKDRRWLNRYYPKSGDYIKAWIDAFNWEADNDTQRMFCGRFMMDEISFSGYPQQAEIKGISVPIRTNFNVTQKNKTWKKSSTKSILSDLAKNGGLTLVYDADNHSISEISQSGQSDLSFAFNLCSQYDLSLKLYNNKMIVYDQSRYEKKQASFKLTQDNLRGDVSYNFTSQITQIYDSVKIQYTKDKKTLTYSYTIPGEKSNRTMFITSKADSYKEAEIKAKAKLRENRRSSKKLTLRNLVGSPEYLAAQNFELEGFGKIDGKYFIEKVTHDKSETGWTCSITAHPVVTF